VWGSFGTPVETEFGAIGDMAAKILIICPKIN